MELPFEIDKVYTTKMQTKDKFLLKEIIWSKQSVVDEETGDKKKVEVISGFKGVFIGKEHLGICPLGGDRLIPETKEIDMDIPGMTGPIVDLFNKELTDKEWQALCVVHRMRLRLNLGIRFDWNKSIDVRSETTSQIVDENVFLQYDE